MKNTTYVIIFIVFCVVAFLMHLSNKSDQEETNFIKENYPLLETIETRNVSGIIISVHQSMKQYYRGGFLVELKNSEKFTLMGGTRNYLYTPYDICDFIQVNDSIIYKPAQNDSLYVYRNGKEYYFILDEVLNKEYKK